MEQGPAVSGASTGAAVGCQPSVAPPGVDADRFAPPAAPHNRSLHALPRGPGGSSVDGLGCLQPQRSAAGGGGTLKRRPGSGALAPVADHGLGIWGPIRSGVCDSGISCHGPGRRGQGITSGRRDARGLTALVVIPARVMQPGIGQDANQRWHVALCSYEMAFALRHRVHVWCVASLAHLRCAHRLG